MHHNNNQKGFAVVEAALIVVVLGIIGFTGWFVYHSKQATDQTLSVANESGSQQGTRPATPSSSSGAQAKYLMIKEWGVKISLSDVTSNATYASEDTGSNAVEGFALSTTDTAKIDFTCGGNGTGDPITHHTGSPQNSILRSKDTTTLETLSNHSKLDFTKIADYYYIFARSTGYGNCEITDSKVAARVAATGDEYSKASIVAE